MYSLDKLFSQIKYDFILKKFKHYDKKYLLEKQKANKNIKINNINQDDIIDNENEINETNEIKEDNSDNKINDNPETRITKKKEQNEAYKSRILTSLNSNSKIIISGDNIMLVSTSVIEIGNEIIVNPTSDLIALIYFPEFKAIDLTINSISDKLSSLLIDDSSF